MSQYMIKGSMASAGQRRFGRPRVAWRRPAALAALMLVAATLTACGGDGTGDAETGDASKEAAPAASTAAAETGSSGSAYGSGRECPAESVVSEAMGQPMVADPSTPATAGFFCPYTSPDAALTLSVTFTNMNMTRYPEPAQEQVAGVGEAALWSESGDELVVWTGRDSLIVSILAGPSLDSKAAAVALAGAVLAHGGP
jgi:hypothetical protein